MVSRSKRWGNDERNTNNQRLEQSVKIKIILTTTQLARQGFLKKII